MSKKATRFPDEKKRDCYIIIAQKKIRKRSFVDNNIIFEKLTLQTFKTYIGLISQKIDIFYWILNLWVNFRNMKNRVVGSDWFTQDLRQLI